MSKSEISISDVKSVLWNAFEAQSNGGAEYVGDLDTFNGKDQPRITTLDGRFDFEQIATTVAAWFAAQNGGER
jgi:hypothetical protein